MRGVNVSGAIITIGESDTYATHIDNLGKGGVHSVDTLIMRDATPPQRRTQGMLCYVSETNLTYALIGGITNEYWQEALNFNQSLGLLLQDFEVDLIQLKRDFDRVDELKKLDRNRIWIGNYDNEPQQQINIGLINMPQIGAAVFPVPFDVISIPLPNPTFDPISGLDWLMSGAWLPQIFAGSPGRLDSAIKDTVLSSSLAMTQIKTAQAIKRLDNTGFIVKTREINFVWENPAMLAIPEAVQSLYDLKPSYTFTKAQALDELTPEGEAGGILYTSADGTLRLAVGGLGINDDFALPSDLRQEIEDRIQGDLDVRAFASEEATAAELAANAFFTAQMLPYVPGVDPLNIGVQISGAIVAAEAAAVVSANQNMAQIKVYVNDDQGTFSTTYSHLIGEGFVTPAGHATQYVAVKLKQSVNLENNDQRFSFDSSSKPSQLAINTYNSAASIFESNKPVYPLQLSFLTNEAFTDLLQPSGRYTVDKGFFFQSEYGFNGDNNQPKVFGFKMLTYRDDKYYLSNPTTIENIFKYDRSKDALVLEKNTIAPFGTTAQRPLLTSLGMVRVNTDNPIPVWEISDGMNWHQQSGGSGSGTVTSITAGNGLTAEGILGGVITNSGTLALTEIFTEGYYTNIRDIAVSKEGRIVGISSLSDIALTRSDIVAGNNIVFDYVPISPISFNISTISNPTFSYVTTTNLASQNATINSALTVNGTLDAKNATFSYISNNITFPSALALKGSVRVNTQTKLFEYCATDGVWTSVGSGGAVTSVGLSSFSSGIASITNSPITNSGIIDIELNPKLNQIATNGTVGFLTVTGGGGSTILSRRLQAGSGINIQNNDGYFGDPIISSSVSDVINITGAVTGSGNTGNIPINTTLNSTQYITNQILRLNWNTSEADLMINLTANTPAPQHAYIVSVGDGTVNFRGITAMFQPGFAGQASQSFSLFFDTYGLARQIPFSISYLGTNLVTYIKTTLDVNNNIIKNVADPSNPQDAVNLRTLQSATTSFGKAVCQGTVSSYYSSNLGVGDHLKFNNIIFYNSTVGSIIMPDTTSAYSSVQNGNTASIGRITLALGFKYKLSAGLGAVSGSVPSVQWYQMSSNTNTPLGNNAIFSTTYGSSGVAIAYVDLTSSGSVDITPSASETDGDFIVIPTYLKYELRITGAINNLDNISTPPWFTVETI